jgi:hypothetical protein
MRVCVRVCARACQSPRVWKSSYWSACRCQVPFIGWLADVPVTGPLLHKAVAGAAKPVSGILLGRTGQQFFLKDGEDGTEPLLVRVDMAAWHATPNPIP